MFRAIATLLLTFWVVSVSANYDADSYTSQPDTSSYNEDLEVPWVEIETQIQHLPDDADLRAYRLDKLSTQLSLYLDLKHLSVDPRDKVVRSWVVVKSSAGAYNASYEGFRCETAEYKIYAYANPQRSQPLRRVEFPRWRQLRPTGYRAELARDYLCNGTTPKTEHQIRNSRSQSPMGYDSPY